MTRVHRAGLALAGLLAATGLAAAEDRIRHDTAVIERHQLERLGFPGGDQAGIALEVVLPRRTYFRGEPIPAFLVVANRGRNQTTLDGRVDAFGPRTRTVGQCRLFLRRLDAPGPALCPPRQHGGAHLQLQGRGYSCVRTDLARLGDGASLPSGRYRFHWELAGRVSRQVAFEIRRRGVSPPPPRPRVSVLRLNGRYGGGLVRVPPLTSVRPEGLAAGLAAGVGERHYPDLHAVPSRDARLALCARIEAGHLHCTLRSRRGGDLVRIAVSRLRLFVVRFHAKAAPAVGDTRQQELEKQREQRDVVITDTFSFKLRLPQRWRELEKRTSDSKLALLLTSDRVVMSLGSKMIEQLKELRELAPKRWRGALMCPLPVQHEQRHRHVE